MISLTLPSIHPDALARTLTNLRDATRGPYQVIVASPFQPPSIVSVYGTITWAADTECNGCNAGHAIAAECVQGDYVVAWVDDHLFVDGWDVLALKEFEYPFSCVVDGIPAVCGLRQVYPEQVGTVFGWYYSYFPMMRRDHFKRVGWFDRDFREDFADCDLALRTMSCGGHAFWAESASIVVHHDDNRKAGRPVNQSDLVRFVSRWSGRFGAGWQTNDLRDFNIDVSLTDRRWVDSRLVITGRTIEPRGSQ